MGGQYRGTERPARARPGCRVGRHGYLPIRRGNRSAKAGPIWQVMRPSDDDWESLPGHYTPPILRARPFCKYVNKRADTTAHCSNIVCRFLLDNKKFSYEIGYVVLC